MKNQWIIAVALVCILCRGEILLAKPTQTETSDEVLQKMTNDDRGRRIEELARSVVNLERQMDRLDDRFEKLDRDLKELKRKI